MMRNLRTGSTLDRDALGVARSGKNQAVHFSGLTSKNYSNFSHRAGRGFEPVQVMVATQAELFALLGMFKEDTQLVSALCRVTRLEELHTQHAGENCKRIQFK